MPMISGGASPSSASGEQPRRRRRRATRAAVRSSQRARSTSRSTTLASGSVRGRRWRRSCRDRGRPRTALAVDGAPPACRNCSDVRRARPTRPAGGFEEWREELVACRPSSRSRPCSADVVGAGTGWRTPRIDMHRCSASTTTPTPFGASVVAANQSAICTVMRSCTCSRRANSSTTRASFDSPRMRSPGM